MSQDSNISEVPTNYENLQLEPYPRPQGLAYPQVWIRFEGRAREDGSIPRFRVQDLTEEYFQAVLKVFPEFVKEENTNKLLQTSETNSNVDLGSKWRLMLMKKVSVICLTDDEEVPRVAGFNLNEVYTKDEFQAEANMVKSLDILNNIPSIKEQVRAVYGLKEDGDVFKRYNVDKYMDAMGLYVFPEFRRNGIALQLLRARIPLCKALGIGATANTFSSHPVRSVATKAGFEVITEISIAEIGRRFGNNELPPDEYIKFMGMKIE